MRTSMHTSRLLPPACREKGVALVISLVFLLLLTLLGVVAMRTTNLEESMANNAQDKMVAFQAAEAALRAGEALFTESGAPFAVFEPQQVAPCCSDPSTQVWQSHAQELYGADEDHPVLLSTRDKNWWDSHGRGYGSNLQRVNSAPRFLVEFQAFQPPGPAFNPAYGSGTGLNYYRITAYATGMTDGAQVLLQSTIAKPYK